MAKHDEWGTPPKLFTALDSEFAFELDAAATDENHLCPSYITAEQDALVTPWNAKSVWCNPPYSMLKEFMGRGYQQNLEQKNTIIMLVPAYTDTGWWGSYATQAHEVRFLNGRLRFWENGKPGKDTARFSSAVIIYKHIPGRHYGKSPNQWVWDWRA